MINEFYFGRSKLIIDGITSFGELDAFRLKQSSLFEVTGRFQDFDLDSDVLQNVFSPDERTGITAYNGGWLIYDKEKKKSSIDGIWVDKNYSSFSTNDKSMKRLRVVFDAVLPMHGGTALHASCVKYKDYGICFCGPSGTGKSTHARLWKDRFDAPMISSDTPTVYPEKNGGATAYGMPWDGSDHIITQESKPVKAIVELRQAKHNSMRRLTENQAFQLLLRQGHMPMWDQEAMFMEMAVLKKLSRSVPFYRLNCLPEIGAAEFVERVLFGNRIKDAYKEEKEMKVKEGYVLREVMGDYIVMPTGDNMKKFEGALVLSETSAFVWEKLQKNVSKSDLLKDVLAEFDVEEEVASKDIDELIERLNSFGVLDEID